MDIELIRLILESLGIFSGGVIIIVIIVGYFSKKLFEQYLNNKIETYKTELHLITTKYSIQFSKLHNERAELIKDVYSQIITINLGIKRFEILDFNSEEHLIQINETFKAFWTLKEKIMINKILFNEEIGKIIKDLMDKYQQCVFNYRGIVESEKSIRNPLYTNSRNYHCEKIQNNWGTIDDLIDIQAPIILEKLENNFRELLGVEK